VDRESGAEDGMFAMALLIVRRLRAIRVERVDGGVIFRSRRPRHPGVVGERLHTGERHVSALGGWLCGRDRRFAPMGGVLFQRTVGRISMRMRNYAPIFIFCGSAVCHCWMLIHMLAPHFNHDYMTAD